MIGSCIPSLTLASCVGFAKSQYVQTNFFSLPVVDIDNKVIGVVRLKDILQAKDEEEAIERFVTNDYIQILENNADQEFTGLFSEQYTEIFVTDINNRLVDIINIAALLKSRIWKNEIKNEEQFLKQILRPTSLAKSILDDLNDGIVLVDKNSLILYANKAYGDILGVPFARVIGRYLSQIEPEAKILDVLLTGEKVTERIINVKSLKVFVSVNIIPIRFQNIMVGAVSIFSDITKITNIATEMEKMNIVNNLLTQEITSDIQLPRCFYSIIGNSSKLRKQLICAAKIAPTEAPVLILGESGTGKELIARAIHEASPRANGPFISINCAAIPDNLLESELFGYEEGAFTGAKKGGKIGKFEQAVGGTIFLDEIGDMPLPMQTKLLRFLQDKELNKVGGIKPIKIDIRFLFATNKNLVQMKEDKQFREDLFYRINVFTITLPPLRERKIDILNTIEFYKKFYEEEYNKIVSFSPECMRLLLNYHWPGNVRELKNVIEHLVVMSNDLILIENLPEYLMESSYETDSSQVIDTDMQPLITRLKETEKKAILDALLEANNNKSKAMKILKISRRTFYKKLKELNL